MKTCVIMIGIMLIVSAPVYGVEAMRVPRVNKQEIIRNQEEIIRRLTEIERLLTDRPVPKGEIEIGGEHFYYDARDKSFEESRSGVYVGTTQEV